MSASMLLPILAGGISLVTTAHMASTVAKGLETGATLAQVKAALIQKGVIDSQTPVIWANTVAWIAKATAENAWLGPLLATILVTAIVGVTIALAA